MSRSLVAGSGKPRLTRFSRPSKCYSTCPNEGLSVHCAYSLGRSLRPLVVHDTSLNSTEGGGSFVFFLFFFQYPARRSLKGSPFHSHDSLARRRAIIRIGTNNTNLKLFNLFENFIFDSSSRIVEEKKNSLPWPRCGWARFEAGERFHGTI